MYLQLNQIQIPANAVQAWVFKKYFSCHLGFVGKLALDETIADPRLVACFHLNAGPVVCKRRIVRTAGYSPVAQLAFLYQCSRPGCVRPSHIGCSVSCSEIKITCKMKGLVCNQPSDFI